MKPLVLISFAPVLMVAISVCQTPSAGVQRFHWNWRESDTSKNTITEERDISADQRALLLDALTLQFRGDPQARERAAQVRIKVVDLNGDGVPEIIAQAVGDVCSPTGNCPFWIFQKSESGYRLILKRGAIQNFTLQPTRTYGYFDLVLGMHGSATEQGLHVYQFRGGKYRLTGCYWAIWTVRNKNNKIRNLNEPRLIRCFSW